MDRRVHTWFGRSIRCFDIGQSAAARLAAIGTMGLMSQVRQRAFNLSLNCCQLDLKTSQFISISRWWSIQRIPYEDRKRADGGFGPQLRIPDTQSGSAHSRPSVAKQVACLAGAEASVRWHM